MHRLRICQRALRVYEQILPRSLPLRDENEGSPIKLYPLVCRRGQNFPARVQCNHRKMTNYTRPVREKVVQPVDEENNQDCTGHPVGRNGKQQ